ncbi:MAG: nucleoside phosphorylase [Ruminococcaceae bacterium]|nr:nucleoside phosphorylase [Oscillospiraceae bacterium]
MAEEKMLYPCIHVGDGEIAERVLVCGDPARAEWIGSMLEGSRCLAKNREFWTYTGTHKGVPVTVSSHGVGAGGAVSAFESLWRAGARVIIRIGTCGGMQPEVKTGDIVVATAACREDGVTDKIVPASYPAIADCEVISALISAAAENKTPVHKGIVLTGALFYPGLLESRVKLYAKAGVMAFENEVAGLLVVSSLHKVKAGAIIVADAPAFELVGVEGYQPDEDALKIAQEAQIKIALDAIVKVSV